MQLSEPIRDELERAGLSLVERPEGLCLEGDGLSLSVDFSDMCRRIASGSLQRELLVRAAKIKGADEDAVVLDATAGLGQDSLLLAAASFQVELYERNPVIVALLSDAVSRARLDPGLRDAACRMHVHEGDSVQALRSDSVHPDVVYLDPMFPERKKSAAVKKKFQLLQRLEAPCDDAEEILQAAMFANPKKIVIKRPLKGPYLGAVKPDYSLKGKAIRYDVLVNA